MKRSLAVVGLGVVVAGGIASVITRSHASASSSVHGELQVFYAGSMTKTMEQKIGPEFSQANHVSFRGQGAGSAALAQLIRSGLKQPDVFISASPSVNNLLMGNHNQNLVNWYLTMARDSLVIAYNPHGRFATEFRAVKAGTTPWYQVLVQPGFLLGRTDPALDPKGAYTAIMFELADRYYKQPSLSTKILGSIENAKQVFPEENLLADLNLGQIDAIVAYKHEAVEWGVPYISLPASINLGDASKSAFYATAKVAVNGKVTKGAPIVFTVTIPENAKNPTVAQAFLKYILHGKGHNMLLKDGFTGMPVEWFGDKASIPKTLTPLVESKW